VLNALGKPDEALRLSERLLKGAREGRRLGRVIEILVIKALALSSQGHTDEAVNNLAQALELAKPESYARIFLDEGQPLPKLLELSLSRDIQPAYSQKLLEEFRRFSREPPETGEASQHNQEGAELLSERELEVLQLLGRGLTNQEIAANLCVSQNTIKTHVKNIHSKLGTRNRTEATTRAQALGLLQK
jgi:LuxR family maltose regulon positive regulatory protein